MAAIICTGARKIWFFNLDPHFSSWDLEGIVTASSVGLGVVEGWETVGSGDEVGVCGLVVFYCFRDLLGDSF